VRFSVACLFVVIAVAPVLACAAPPLTAGAAVPAKMDGAVITPHRAIYDMTLVSTKNGSNVADVSGRMVFEWSDVCDAWAVQQRLGLHFNYAQGDTSNVTSTEVTWEAKAGKRYNFNIRRVADGKETDNFRGKAELSASGGKVIYSNPEKKTATLPADAVFPSMHTREIIARALAGETFFTRRVFDGTDEDGSNDVSVYIGAPQSLAAKVTVDDKLDSHALLQGTAWPVHMAFFKLDSETGTPDYEMDLTILANGVVRNLRIDYGDFSVAGTLRALEPLPAPRC